MCIRDRNGETVEAALTEMIHVIGENMKVSRTTVRKPAAGGVASYILSLIHIYRRRLAAR